MGYFTLTSLIILSNLKNTVSFLEARAHTTVVSPSMYIDSLKWPSTRTWRFFSALSSTNTGRSMPRPLSYMYTRRFTMAMPSPSSLSDDRNDTSSLSASSSLLSISLMGFLSVST